PRSTAAATSGRRGRRGFPDRPPACCAMHPSVGLPPPLRNANKPPALRNANNILLSAKGGVMAQMRRIFYWRIKLAILLIVRPVATMLPQAAHRRATLAARCDIRPSRRIRGPAQRMQIGGVSFPDDGAGRAALRRRHIFTPCSAKYFS